jgi:tetratricopeptide (TPR) repeat protein
MYLSEPADRTVNEARRGLWCRLRTRASFASKVIAVVCSLSLTLLLLAFAADLDAALWLRTKEGGTTEVPGAERLAPLRSPPREEPPAVDKAMVPLASKAGGQLGTLAELDGERPQGLSLGASVRNVLGAALPLSAAPERPKPSATPDPDEATPAPLSEPGGDTYVLARRLLQAGDLDAAEQAYRRALEQATAPAAAYELGSVLRWQGRYAEAVASYELAAQLAPDKAYMLYDLGNALAKLGRLDEAAWSFERAAALDATNPYILYDWGWTLERAGALALAEGKYRDTLAVGAGTAAGKNARARLTAFDRQRGASH